jgi:hypothetical protein
MVYIVDLVAAGVVSYGAALARTTSSSPGSSSSRSLASPVESDLCAGIAATLQAPGCTVVLHDIRRDYWLLARVGISSLPSFIDTQMCWMLLQHAAGGTSASGDGSAWDRIGGAADGGSGAASSSSSPAWRVFNRRKLQYLLSHYGLVHPNKDTQA